MRWHDDPRRGAVRSRHHPRQRILRCAAGQPGRELADRLARARASPSMPAASSPSRSRRSRCEGFEAQPAAGGRQGAGRRDLRMARRPIGARPRRRVVAGGAALIIDYGHAAQQPPATPSRRCVPSLRRARWRMPGRTDLTAHVDFAALARAAARPPAPASTARCDRATLLEAAGHRGARARLAGGRAGGQACRHRGRRCCASSAPAQANMGTLFKAMAISAPQMRRPCRVRAHDRTHRGASAGASSPASAMPFSPAGRRLARHLCELNAGVGSRTMPRECRGEPGPHGGRARRRARAVPDLLPDPFARCRGRRRALERRRAAARRRHRDRRPGLAIGVSTADCGPVLFADPAGPRHRRRPCGMARRARRGDRRRRSPRWSASAPHARASSPRSAR